MSDQSPRRGEVLPPEVFRHEPGGDLLDRLVRVTITVFGRPRPAFRVCGYVGLLLAIALALALTIHSSLSVWVMSLLIVSAIGTFLALAMATKIATGEEQLVYYHHEIAVLAVAAALLWIQGQPLLPFLDAQILGVGLFLSCGRVGCFMVGCCHGVPCRWGVRYRPEHQSTGPSPHLVAVRLLPIQLIESIYVLGCVCVGVALVWTAQPAGSALAWYVVSYDTGRFFFEFFRGDPERPYYAGFSEGQWISLGLMVLVVTAEVSGLLPFHGWHAATTAGLLLIAVALRRHARLLTPSHAILNARHLQEVAEALQLVSRPVAADGINQSTAVVTTILPLACTSFGLRISGGHLQGSDQVSAHYALSSEVRPMPVKTARTLARLILRLRHPQSWSTLVAGAPGVFHLLVREDLADQDQARRREVWR